MFQSKKEIGLAVFHLILVFSTVLDAASGSRKLHRSSRGVTEVTQLGGSRSRSNVRCEEGWLYTHGYCLLDTGLSPQSAEEYCQQRGALQTQSICLKKPASSPDWTDLAAPIMEVDKRRTKSGDSNEAEVPPSAPSVASPGSSAASPGSSVTHVCPSGWTQFRDYCYFKPRVMAKVCTLLGADSIFDYCVTRVPHQVSTDFLKTVKRLDGSDYNMHRDTRMCCCLGGGLCK